MPFEELTARQQEIYDYIRREVTSRGIAPSVREIAAAVGLSSPSTVHAHLAALEDRGYIRRDKQSARGIIVLGLDSQSDAEAYEKLSSKVIEMPLLGRVAAGTPILAEEHVEDILYLPSNFIDDSNSFLLEVKGDSMIEIGMFDGDYIVVKEQHYAENGDVVVALIDDEATVKTYYRESDGRIRLQPENSSMEPLYPDEPYIIGKVTALFRHV